MRMTKKITSIVLAVMMVVSMMSVMAVTANAAVGDYVAEEDYLTFTAEEANSSVTLKFRNGSNFKYNKNNSGWQDYTKGTQITLNDVGDYVRFSGKDTEFNDYNHVSLTGKVACSGNVMSLRLDDNGKSQGLINYCFQYMFSDCTGLTTAPELPETTLARYCYGAMFVGCTNLTKAPDLPATNLADYCYRYMFRGCENLTELPALPATTLADNCYAYMFYGCPKICISDVAGTFDGITYSAEYRIPSTGTGTPAEDALDDMFGLTGGKFEGTPNINTIYYLPAPAPSTYTVTWKNGDTVLDTDEVEEGETPSYTGATPVKTDDSNNIYTFSGWTPEITAVTGDVTYTATFTSTPAVAKIGSTKYETFAEAVAGRASNDDVIELLAAAGSYTMTADQSIKVIKNSKSLTLNAPAGAYAVAYTYNSTTKVYTYTVVEAVASATKNDTTTYYASANDALKNAATGSTITLLKDSTESAVSVGSKLSGKTYTIDLNDKTLTLNGSGNALFNIASPSNVTIQNGKIVFDGTGTNQNGILLNDVYNNAVLTIEDDVVIEATGTSSAVTVTGGTLNTEGALSSQNAPAIDTTNNSMGQGYTINVTGGSVTSTGDTAICQRVATGELNITGGNISGDTAAVQAINNTDDTVAISGGTFNTPVPEEYCADGFIPKDNGDGTYGVKVPNYVAEDVATGTKYESVNDAVAAAGEGGEVKLIADITGNVGIDGDYTTTLDLNGYTITNTSGSGITLYSKYPGGKTFTIKDTSAAQTGGITITKKYPGDGCISDSSGRKVVIEGGTYTSNDKALYISSDEGWTINGGTFNGKVHVLSDVDITDGTFNGEVVQNSKPDYSTPYPWTQIPAEIEISGGTFANPVPEEFCADGYIPKDNGDNTYGVKVGTYVAQDVATGTKYESVNDAVAAAGEGGEVKLIADITGNVGIDGDYTTTLDLNGYTITNPAGSGITLYSKYPGGKTFTIKDTSAAQTGGITITKKYPGDGCISDSSGRKVVIEGGTYTSNDKALYISSDEGWTINGGTFNGKVHVLSDVDITDGTFNGEVVQNSKPDYSTPYPWTQIPAEIEISGGTFVNPVPEEFCANGYAPKDNGNGTYGVGPDTSSPLNPLEKAAADINDGNLFGISSDYLKGTLLGVQKKTVAGEGTSSQEGEKNMRFVAVLDTDLIQDADDYGFVLAKVTDTTTKTFGYDNTNFDNLKANMGNGEKTISAKGTYNNVCGNEAYGDPSNTNTDYKYITCAVNNVTDNDKVIARFYYKKDGKTYYAKYAGHNYQYTGCIAAWSDLP